MELETVRNTNITKTSRCFSRLQTQVAKRHLLLQLLHSSSQQAASLANVHFICIWENVEMFNESEMNIRYNRISINKENYKYLHIFTPHHDVITAFVAHVKSGRAVSQGFRV